MKSVKQKRVEAGIRAQGYSYENSKAKRNGVSQEKWEAKRKEYVDRCSQ